MQELRLDDEKMEDVEDKTVGVAGDMETEQT